MQKLSKNSLADLFPQLVAEWDYERNNNMAPEMFQSGSSQKVWWKFRRKLRNTVLNPWMSAVRKSFKDAFIVRYSGGKIVK